MGRKGDPDKDHRKAIVKPITASEAQSSIQQLRQKTSANVTSETQSGIQQLRQKISADTVKDRSSTISSEGIGTFKPEEGNSTEQPHGGFKQPNLGKETEQEHGGFQQPAVDKKTTKKAEQSGFKQFGNEKSFYY